MALHEELRIRPHHIPLGERTVPPSLSLNYASQRLRQQKLIFVGRISVQLVHNYCPYSSLGSIALPVAGTLNTSVCVMQ